MRLNYTFESTKNINIETNKLIKAIAETLKNTNSLIANHDNCFNKPII